MSTQGCRGADKVELQGTHRTVFPRETLARLAAHLPAFGISRIADVTGLDHIGIPTVVVVRPNSRSLSVSQGKGLDLDAAKASAVMESLEQYHAENIDEPLRFAAYADLSKRHRVVDVMRLPRYVRAFDPQQAILWIEAGSLLGNEPALVPFEMVHLNLTLPLPPGSGSFPIGSNGLASGNTLAEASAHAAWELIERDAVALFYQLAPAEQWRRRVDLDSIDDSGARALLQRFGEANVRVGVWDVTSDIGIAAFYAAIVEESFDAFRPVGKASGFGCHADRGIALCRALTEAAQSRLTRITGSRDDLQREDFEQIRSEAAIARQRAELDTPAAPPRRFGDVPSARFGTFEEDLDWIGEKLRGAGLDELLIVDLSREGLPVCVVRAVIPGLESSADVPGYVPGARALARGGRA